MLQLLGRTSGWALPGAEGDSTLEVGKLNSEQ